MAASKSLPVRPSLDSLRKQAKALARDIAAGHADAVARAHAQLPTAQLPLTQRQAQLVLAREYGYAGWQDLTSEVRKRLGQDLEWAAAKARDVIHRNDVDGLKALLAEYPTLLSWRGSDRDGQGGLLEMATGAYADSFDPDRERVFTRAECAELLIDAGAIVTPSACQGLLESRARGLLQLFQRKGLLPRTLTFEAALGNLDGVRRLLDQNAPVLATVQEAFVCACRFGHEAVAAILLDRVIALDPEFGARIDATVGRAAFIRDFMASGPADNPPAHVRAVGPWKAWVMDQVKRSVADRDLKVFSRTLERESWLLGEAFISFQVELIERAALTDREEFINALLDLDPALLRTQPPPPSQAIEFAVTYAHTHLIPVLTRIWRLPDDLPHVAAMGNLSRVKHWFDQSGAPALGDLTHHYPYNDPRARGHLGWNPPTGQQVLDTALAFAVINRHFAVAAFLLDHGADINTNWNSHEPASILHHLVFLPDSYDAMRFLIDRGIDMTIKDYRWDSTAHGWALYGKKDEPMAQWLEDAERQRAPKAP